ncbi:hypothetical protein E5288_WYG015384 [Bos mutus]|uniref:Uncharacterized protein n=1 Tax=Bos mutus TaxID=72004 RepID=A0A6B0SAE5_9CETA|nr:hypothetical protein [Bos mutus]
MGSGKGACRKHSVGPGKGTSVLSEGTPFPLCCQRKRTSTSGMALDSVRHWNRTDCGQVLHWNRTDRGQVLHWNRTDRGQVLHWNRTDSGQVLHWNRTDSGQVLHTVVNIVVTSHR